MKKLKIINETSQQIIMTQIDLFLEANPYRVKVMRVNRAKQINRYAGGAASRIAKQRNAAMARRKAYYRKMYMDMKKREQTMYGNMARAQALRRH